METRDYSTRELVERCINSGLFDYGDEFYFTWGGCDYCNNGLGNTVTDCKGFMSLEEAQNDKDNYYEFKVCNECLNKLYYGEN
jgi:hypothetical protein